MLRPGEEPDGDGDGELVRLLRNLSKMAMRRNMEMRMAVATNPNDTAFTESSKFVHRPSLSAYVVSGATAAAGGPAEPHPR